MFYTIQGGGVGWGKGVSVSTCTDVQTVSQFPGEVHNTRVK